MARSSFRARAASRSKSGARGKGKAGSVAKYAVPIGAAGLLLYFLMRKSEAAPGEKSLKPPVDPKVEPTPINPPGPRPPNTWGDLATAIVQVTDPDPGASPGVRVRTQPSTSAPLVPYGEGSAAYSAYSGKTVAVLETGRIEGDREWWKIITPGGYEGWASAGQISEVAAGQQPNFRRAGRQLIAGLSAIVQKANGAGPATAGTGNLMGMPFQALSPTTLRTLAALNAQGQAPFGFGRRR